MITFENEEEFQEAVMKVLQERLNIGVTVTKQSEWYSDNIETKVRVSLFDTKTGDNIDFSSDCA